MMVGTMVADASDGPHSSLSLGLAHDVFALPLLQCQRFNPASASATPPLWPSLTKVGLLRATDIHPTATLMLRQVARPAPSTISPPFPLRCLIRDNEGIEMRGMFTATFMHVMHLLQFTGKDDA